MPLAEEMLTAALLGAAAVTDRVGQRVTPAGGSTDPALEAISYQRISTVGTEHLGGGGSLDQVRMQIGCWARTALAALELAGIVRDVIAPEDTAGLAVFVGGGGAELDSETRTFGVSWDYFIWQERS